jgi:hypothetical protein
LFFGAPGFVCRLYRFAISQVRIAILVLHFGRRIMPADQLIIFLKAPHAGAVKTRLAQAIGADAACAAYRRLVEVLLNRLTAIDAVELRFAPDDALEEIKPWLRPGWRAAGQGAGDLGQRLTRAFAEAFATGARRVVVIGSDCPDVTPDDIHAAWASLGRHDLVFGPAADGGYWLIGLCRAEPRLFDGIAWSTDTVLQKTRDRARAAGLTVHLLRELHDVDSDADWRRFLERGE